MEISVILGHYKKRKQMERIFLSAQNLFVKKRRFNAESVKILIAAYAFFLIVQPKIAFQNSSFSIPRFLPFDKICGFQMKVYFKRQKYCRLKTLRVCRTNSQIYVYAFAHECSS